MFIEKWRKKYFKNGPPIFSLFILMSNYKTMDRIFTAGFSLWARYETLITHYLGVKFTKRKTNRWFEQKCVSLQLRHLLGPPGFWSQIPVPSFDGSARHAVPQSRTQWRRCTAALCSTYSAPELSLLPPPAAAVDAPVVSLEEFRLCRVCGPIKQSSLQGWSCMESWGRKTKYI